MRKQRLALCPFLIASGTALTLAVSGCGGGAREEAGPRPETSAREAPADLTRASVTLEAGGGSAAGIEVVLVEEVRSTFLETTGTVSYDQDHVSLVGPATEGRIERVVADLGARVKTGDTLATLASAALGEVQADYGRESAEVELAKNAYEREKSLYEQHVSSEKEMLEARAAYESAVVSQAAAEARVRTLGGQPGELASRFRVSSPLAGTVIERSAVPGQMVGPESRLFTVADLQRLWLVADIFEKDLARVLAGQAVEVSSGAFPGAVFPGRIAYVGQLVDPGTRTFKVRVQIENRDRLLRPGMFVQAAIELPLPPASLAVPTNAIQEIQGVTVVFVPQGDTPTNRFVARPIEVGETLRDHRVLVRAGLSAGERVVGAGSFALKSELLEGSFGDTD
jgi:cobalt-zinc-cadmium efflux system membrane fusion protein